MSNIIFNPTFDHYIKRQSLAQCRDCLVPMIGILSYGAREYCIDHKHLHEGPQVDLKLYRGL